MMTTKHIFVLSVLIVFLTVAKAQHTFDTHGGCLNVIDVGYAPKMGSKADGCVSINYKHEMLLNEHFSFGGGIGYCHRTDYKMSTIPLYFSSTYFFLDKTFSPFVCLHAGWFGIVDKRNVDNKEPFSVSSKPADFNLFLSPSIGIKTHLTEQVGLLLSASYNNYMLNAYNVKKTSYRKQLIGNIAINIGVCFQIPGW